MTRIYRDGELNKVGLVIPDLYINIVPPQPIIEGVPTDIVGVVGTATWGPVGVPTPFGDGPSLVAAFGRPQSRKHDMGTVALIAMEQGAASFRGVRVTDGTDVAASVVVQTNCITFTARYTGSAGNAITVTIATGSAAGSFRAIVAPPFGSPEIFDNIVGSGNAFWANLAAAINAGQGQLRGPSETIIATAGVGVTAPALATVTLASGTDGAATITSSTLLGVDTTPRRGMYALRGSPVMVFGLADADDVATWASQISFAKDEAMFVGLAGPVGQSISTAVTAKRTGGFDDWTAKVLLGDHVLWQDRINNVRRFVSPLGFWLGRRARLSPEQSSLNKPVFGVIETGRGQSGNPYSRGDLDELALNGIDVITNPIPRGNVFGFRMGRNSSSQVAVRGENYTMMTYFIARTLDRAMGIFVGEVHTLRTRERAKATIENFLEQLQVTGMIGNPNAPDQPAFSVQIDAANNPDVRVEAGFMEANVLVRYLSIIEYFIINLEGGQSVRVTRANTEAA
jgi:hypothetical protein